ADASAGPPLSSDEKTPDGSSSILYTSDSARPNEDSMMNEARELEEPAGGDPNGTPIGNSSSIRTRGHFAWVFVFSALTAMILRGNESAPATNNNKGTYVTKVNSIACATSL
ncbi:hypothetical protein THAOC_30170, partial [Thalassiosira oceanica]